MDNLDDSENNAKVSDCAYSSSCSNSQSRRSHSSKSTHSGSNSSGSSGYGGKPSTSGSSNNLLPHKKEKEQKKKKLLPQIETLVSDILVEGVRAPGALVPPFDALIEDNLDVIPTPPVSEKNGDENITELTTKDMVVSSNILQSISAADFASVCPVPASYCPDEFSCVVSMQDGAVMYATTSLMTTLGFPKDMWIGRSFIDFVHPWDRNGFASQITNGLAVPKIANGTQENDQCPVIPELSMVCRIRRYKGLTSGFGVKDSAKGFMPLLLRFTFRNINHEEGEVVYLVVQATPFYSAFKTPNEMVIKAIPFVIRHAANGQIEHVDPESVSYLGYLPQDLAGKDALMLYHPEDLMYLLQVYDTIVKEGGLPRSKPYRILTQNGEYIRLETEWSSFINPWSKKLEFVIAKHHVIEGPNNPDVFHAPDPGNLTRMSDEEIYRAQMLRDTIFRTMNESLTKPAKLAKQQMTNRCQELATFMESLMEEVPKTDEEAPKTDEEAPKPDKEAPKAKEELRMKPRAPDPSYYERDWVMLGGISPHHDYYDSKSYTETLLSYNQLNYNDTLQRYFDRHQAISYEGSNASRGENIYGVTARPYAYMACLSPMAQHSRDSGELSCSSDSMITMPNSPKPAGDKRARLTEALLKKHDTHMEKELKKIHRDTRPSIREDRENKNETRQKKKQHLARCNESYYPTNAWIAEIQQQPHGLKRPSNMEAEAVPRKRHCPPSRQAYRNRCGLSTGAAVSQPPPAAQLAPAPNQWAAPSANMNSYLRDVGYPQPMSSMSPMPHPTQPMPGMNPMYYPPAAPQPMPTSSVHHPPSISHQQQYQEPMTKYGQPMYGTPRRYSPMNNPVTYPMPQPMPQYTNNMNPLDLSSSNYEESSYATNIPPPRNNRFNQQNLAETSDEAPDRTDGESSYSSFYSSFFRTDSSSAEDSGDGRNGNKFRRKSPVNTTPYYAPRPVKKTPAKRNMQPPWLEKVCVNSELVYKYKVQTKSLEETLRADQQRMMTMKQPALVNEQLGQLYRNLQLEGVSTRLSLEEGITSSSSSGEETTTSFTKSSRRKRGYSKLAMIYEEDCPMPPPFDDSTEAASSSYSTY